MQMDGSEDKKVQEAGNEKGYVWFELGTSYYYHKDEEAISKALYDVKIDAMNKEPSVIQDVFRTITEGKDGTITEAREKDVYWDSRTIGISCGKEEYLVQMTHSVDENYRDEYSASIMASALQKELERFIKKLKDILKQNYVNRVNVVVESKNVSKKYLQNKFEVDKQVLVANEKKPSVSVKSLEFARENSNEVTKVFIRPEAFTRIKNAEGKSIGVSVNGYRAPDGEYYKAELRFKDTEGVSVDIIQKGKFTGWAVAKIKPDKGVKMVALDEIAITVDVNEFEKFIEQKNCKVVRKKEAKEATQDIDRAK